MVNLFSVIDLFQKANQQGHLQPLPKSAKLVPADELMLCYAIPNAKPFRKRKNKWFITWQQYPHKKYPLYCYGTAWFMSMGVFQRLHEASKKEPEFNFDDVMITGIVRERAHVQLLQIVHHFKQHVNHTGPQVTKGTVVFLTSDMNVFQELWFNIVKHPKVKIVPKVIKAS
jgi:hypothetical protein